MKNVLTIVLFFVSCSPFFTAAEKAPDPADRFALATYVGNHVQERSARALIQSVREFAGPYRNAPVYVVLGDAANFPCDSLKGENNHLLPLEMDPAFKDYPLAYKAFAAAQVEKAVGNRVKSLAWFDPACLVLGSLADLDLENGFGAAIRPVSLVNTIGIPPGEPPNDYWLPIYRELGLDAATLPAYETVVDEKPIQPYFNCEIFSVDPCLGVFSEWADMLTGLLKDETYQKQACTSFLRRLFLHQAVLSGVIISRVQPDKIKPLPLKTGYPFGQHDRLAAARKADSLNDLSALILDYAWDRDAAWLDRIPVAGGLKQRLIEAYTEYLRLTDRLYRIEGSCNSYLVLTNGGSVLIDPAGASAAPQYFQRLIADHPLKAILLTHAHRDHWDGLEAWRSDPSIPVIAQRYFTKYNEYWKRLAPFFARRGAIWARQPLPDPGDVEAFEPVVPSITFADEYTLELDGFHFHMVHTPGETPDHATIWIPELAAVFVGDNYYAYFVNNATLRGTLPRPLLGYIHALDLALSYDPEFFLMGHGTPLVRKPLIRDTVTNFRDALRYIHDETIAGINRGKDVCTLMREIKVPERFGIRPYFGKVEWTVRGVYEENVGWFDEDPASMYGLPVSSVYGDLVDLVGADAIIARAERRLAAGDPVQSLHLTAIVLKNDPGHAGANTIRIKALKTLRAGTFNYIERIWLDFGIRVSEENLATAKADGTEAKDD